MVAQDDHAQITGNITQFPTTKSKAIAPKTITPHELNLKFSEISDELSELLLAYNGLTWLCLDSEVEFKHAYFIIDSLNKRFKTAINNFDSYNKKLI